MLACGAATVFKGLLTKISLFGPFTFLSNKWKDLLKRSYVTIWEGLFDTDANVLQTAWRIKHFACWKPSEYRLESMLSEALVCKLVGATEIQFEQMCLIVEGGR